MILPDKYTYFAVNLFTVIFPFLFSFTKWFNFKDYWKYYFPGNLVIAIIYLLWDAYYTYLGVWGFGFQYTLGYKILGLPIDEVFFFICTPYACTFTYFCFRKYVFCTVSNSTEWIWIFSIALFMIIAGIHYTKLYTFLAFTTSALASFMAYRLKLIAASHYYLFYFVILFPFLLCNGILTGSFLDRVVVHYNDAENLGFRILTIPFDDVFYGMALLLFNILSFEFLMKKAGVSIK